MPALQRATFHVQSPMPILTTERLLLRHLEPDDLEALFALVRDPEVRRFPPDGVLTRARTRDEIEGFRHRRPQHPTLGPWAAIDRASGKILGRCGLLPWGIDGRFEVELASMVT